MATAQDPPPGELEPNLRHRLPLPRWGDRRTPRRASAERSGGDRTPTAGPLGCGRFPLAQDGVGGGDDGGLEELRAKLMGHLRVAADRMKIATPEAAPELSRPWNLRARKSSNGNTGCAITGSTAAAAAAAAGSEAEEERKRKIGLSVPLTAEEIEEDIYAVTGSRPRRRPKKRPRVVQRQIDSLFPGLWLSDITVEAYKVDDD